MRKHVAVGAVLLTVVATACSRQTTSGGGSQVPVSAGQSAPGFTLPSASDGAVSLSDFAGKPVLLYFSMGPG
jgi:cytochrome oxidase Cu insertion factor (SCO1/SenC/PrrC family)